MARTFPPTTPTEQPSPAPATSTRTIPVVASERTIPVDLHYATRCHWPCPCGGTVPDAPRYCKHAKSQPRARTKCVDVLICQSCTDQQVCLAYKAWKERIKVQRLENERKSIELEKSRKE